MHWIAHRDEAAFKELMAAWLPLVRTVCRRVLVREDLAEDAVQETFLTLAREASHIHGNLSSWLYRTAMNHAIDLRRSEQARHRREQNYGREQATYEDFQAPAEHEFLLEECLGELDSDQRSLIRSYYFEGRSQYEIADLSGVSQVAVKKRIDRALMSLRVKLVRRGIDMVAPPSRDGRAHGMPMLIPIGWTDLAQLLGGAILLLLIFQPRQACERIRAAIQITGYLVAALLGTMHISTLQSHLRDSFPTPWWVRTLRIGSAGAATMLTLASVLVGRR
jgi:RNA polymerase sigma-70 factor (ECF subfamily)